MRFSLIGALFVLALASSSCSDPAATYPPLPAKTIKQLTKQLEKARELAAMSKLEIGGLTWHVPAGREKPAREAIRLFLETCPGVPEHQADFVEAIAELEETVGPPGPDVMYEERGWAEVLALRLRIAERPQTFEPQAGGHVLWFWLGSGARPGIRVSQKLWGLQVCGLEPPSEGRDPIQSVPALAGILGEAPAGWRPPAK